MGPKALNFFWTVTGGLVISLLYLLAALVFMVTVVYFQTGLSLLRLSWYNLTPFSTRWKSLVHSDISFDEPNPVLHAIRCVLWFPFFVVISLAHICFTLLLCLTIVGIRLARTHYMLLRFAVFPMIDSPQTRDAVLLCD